MQRTSSAERPFEAPSCRAVEIGADNPTESDRSGCLALDIWEQTTPIAGTVVERYLESRGIQDLTLGIDGEVLRFHPSCPYRGARRPCMVALLRSVLDDEPRAIQRTALTPAGGKIGRKTLGPKSGAAVKLSAETEVSERLVIGEGVETTLSAMMLGYFPAWAVGDAGELENWYFPQAWGAVATSECSAAPSPDRRLRALLARAYDYGNRSNEIPKSTFDEIFGTP